MSYTVNSDESTSKMSCSIHLEDFHRSEEQKNPKIHYKKPFLPKEDHLISHTMIHNIVIPNQ